MPDLIIYEHPLKERIRTLLRLEHLFEQLAFHSPQSSVWSTRAAINSLLDIISIFSRGDLKSEILKELERHAGTLGRIRNQPGIDMQMLGRILDDLEQMTSRMFRVNGQIGQRLRENEFLKSITQRNSIPGGSCAFDLPQFHYWLQQPDSVRHQQLQDWSRDLEPTQNAVVLLLALTRGSTTATNECAPQGLYQKTLDSQSPAQLIRVGIDARLPLFAEISGGKHRFNIRFIETDDTEHLKQTQADVNFSLTCCVI